MTVYPITQSRTTILHLHHLIRSDCHGQNKTNTDGPALGGSGRDVPEDLRQEARVDAALVHLRHQLARNGAALLLQVHKKNTPSTASSKVNFADSNCNHRLAWD